MQGTSQSELAAELERSARLCEETARSYLARGGESADPDVVSVLLLASAAMDSAWRKVEDDPPARETALLIAGTLAGDAAGTVEERGLDAALVDCVSACRRVVQLCAES